MKTLKFRVWEVKEKRMLLPYEDIYIHQNGKVYLFMGSAGINSIWNKSDDFIIMQFTGLKDKNGIDIFEGDIVKIIWDIEKWSKRINPEIFEVKWDGYDDGEYVCNVECWMIGDNSLSDLLTYTDSFSHPKCVSVEVIGNIFENKDLLKD